MIPRVAIVVGTFGRGSNMVALYEACRSGRVPALIERIVCPNLSSPAAESARALGLQTIGIPSRGDTLQPLMHALEGMDFVCLAGYTRLVPSPVVQSFDGRMLNIHPALLPKFGGQGLYGMRVHEAVLAAGENESGCTVHYVSESYDEGRSILQLRCPAYPDDTPESLAARVLTLEHVAYPMALEMVIRERKASSSTQGPATTVPSV